MVSAIVISPIGFNNLLFIFNNLQNLYLRPKSNLTSCSGRNKTNRERYADSNFPDTHVSDDSKNKKINLSEKLGHILFSFS